jgi:integrase
VHGKGGKLRYLPLHPGTLNGAITADGIYRMVKNYAKRVGVNIEGFGAHSLRATAATEDPAGGQSHV